MDNDVGSFEQLRLSQNQIEEFYVDCFARNQADNFIYLLKDRIFSGCVVDVGGGIGAFARELAGRSDFSVRVLDSDAKSVDICNRHQHKRVFALVADAFNPPFFSDEEVACFNLILHHLVGASEAETRSLQGMALSVWREKVKYVYVDEYIYESFFYGFSGRLIYEITSSKLLSFLCSKVAKFIPSLRANTFGVGVRFREHNEWRSLFENLGYRVVGTVVNVNEPVSLARRLLFIKAIRRDGFLLEPL